MTIVQKLKTELTRDQAILHLSPLRKELKSGSPRAYLLQGPRQRISVLNDRLMNKQCGTYIMEFHSG